MVNKINQGQSPNYNPEHINLKIAIKENRKSTIDNKISVLEGRVERLKPSLENQNIMTKIKSFINIVFFKIQLHNLKQSSVSLANDIKRLSSTLDNDIKKLSSEPLLLTINTNKNLKSYDKALLKMEIDKVFSETSLFNALDQTKTSMQDFFPVIEPRESVCLDPELSKEWINAHEPSFKPIAKILINKINHVTYKKFKSQLKRSVEDFNNYLSKQSDQSYIIVVPGTFQKSSLWVTTIAKDFLAYPPEKIIMIDDPDIKGILRQSTSKNVVMFDDAAYSGSQMSDEYFPEFKDIGKMVHPIIPFMTKSAENKFSVELEKLQIKYKLHKHATMDSFSKFLSDKQKRLLTEEGTAEFKPQSIDKKTNPSGFDNLTLTYFDHKKPDKWSMVSSIDDGKLLNSYTTIQFVPDVVSPYKK